MSQAALIPSSSSNNISSKLDARRLSFSEHEAIIPPARAFIVTTATTAAGTAGAVLSPPKEPILVVDDDLDDDDEDDDDDGELVHDVDMLLRHNPELLEEELPELLMPENFFVEDMEYLENITSCNKVENYVMLSEMEHILSKESEKSSCTMDGASLNGKHAFATLKNDIQILNITKFVFFRDILQSAKSLAPSSLAHGKPEVEPFQEEQEKAELFFQGFGCIHGL